MVVDKSEEEKKKSKKGPSPEKGGVKLIIIIIIAALLIGGAAAYFLYFKEGIVKEPAKEVPVVEKEEKKEEIEKEDEEEILDANTIPVPEYEGRIIVALNHFIVNIDDNSGKMRNLKIEIELELDNNEIQKEVQDKESEIREGIVTILKNKRVADISGVKGKSKLKEEIKENVNSFLTLGKVKELYFTDFIIQ